MRRRLALIIVFLAYLLAGVLADSLLYNAGHQRELAVVGWRAASVTVKLELADGETVKLELRAPSKTSLPENVVSVSYAYACQGKHVEVSVRLHHNRSVYVLVVPPFLFQERNVSIELDSYSVLDENWAGAPWGLEIMVGTENAIVEEGVSGRVFEMLYWEPWVEARVQDLLDHAGVHDERCRREIAATALWAAQLVRECVEGNVNHVIEYHGLAKAIGRSKAVLAAPLWLLGVHTVKHMPRTLLYKAVLEGIKSVEEYTRVFPEWYKIDENTWLRMCMRFENAALPPLIPSYAHTLLLGAFLVYCKPLLTILFLTAIALVTRHVFVQEKTVEEKSSGFSLCRILGCTTLSLIQASVSRGTR